MGRNFDKGFHLEWGIDSYSTASTAAIFHLYLNFFRKTTCAQPDHRGITVSTHPFPRRPFQSLKAKIRAANGTGSLQLNSFGSSVVPHDFIGAQGPIVDRDLIQGPGPLASIKVVFERMHPPKQQIVVLIVQRLV